jgi:hypothetical protein
MIIKRPITVDFRNGYYRFSVNGKSSTGYFHIFTTKRLVNATAQSRKPLMDIFMLN